MIKLKPKFLKENGQNKFAVFTMSDYEQIRSALEDAEDARILDEARRRNKNRPRISHDQMKRQLGLSGKDNKKRAG